MHILNKHCIAINGHWMYCDVEMEGGMPYPHNGLLCVYVDSSRGRSSSRSDRRTSSPPWPPHPPPREPSRKGSRVNILHQTRIIIDTIRNRRFKSEKFLKITFYQFKFLILIVHQFSAQTPIFHFFVLHNIVPCLRKCSLRVVNLVKPFWHRWQWNCLFSCSVFGFKHAFWWRSISEPQLNILLHFEHWLCLQLSRSSWRLSPSSVRKYFLHWAHWNLFSTPCFSFMWLSKTLFVENDSPQMSQCLKSFFVCLALSWTLRDCFEKKLLSQNSHW